MEQEEQFFDCQTEFTSDVECQRKQELPIQITFRLRSIGDQEQENHVEGFQAPGITHGDLRTEVLRIHNAYFSSRVADIQRTNEQLKHSVLLGVVRNRLLAQRLDLSTLNKSLADVQGRLDNVSQSTFVARSSSITHASATTTMTTSSPVFTSEPSREVIPCSYPAGEEVESGKSSWAHTEEMGKQVWFMRGYNQILVWRDSLWRNLTAFGGSW